MIKALKNYFFNSFRKMFLYNHSSLEFRAKLYTLMIISSNEDFKYHQNSLEDISNSIYSSKDRAEALVMTIKEYFDDLSHKKDRADEILILEILDDLRHIPRFALKIEPKYLEILAQNTHTHNEKLYQEKIIEFLIQKRYEYENPKL